MKPASEVLLGVRDSIREAETAFDNLINAFGDENANYREEREGIVKYFLDRAFMELRLFLEAKELPQMLGLLAADHARGPSKILPNQRQVRGESPILFGRPSYSIRQSH